MTQNIIDQNICEFTVDIMQKLGLEANCQHKARNNVIYNLIKNYKKALDLNPTYDDAAHNLGHTYYLIHNLMFVINIIFYVRLWKYLNW